MSAQTKIEGPDLENDGIEASAIGSDRPAVGHVGDKPVILVRTPGGVRAVGRQLHSLWGPTR